MTGYDRAEAMRVIHEKRKNETDEKVNSTIDQMLNEGRVINFRAVSKEAGVSLSTLYNHEQIKQRIERLRLDNGNKSSKKAATGSASASIIESLTRKNKRLLQENAKLKEEISTLRAAASTRYGDYFNDL